MDPSVDCLHCNPFDGAIERNVKVQGVSFRIFPDDAIWLDDFGTTPGKMSRTKNKRYYDIDMTAK